MREFAYKDEVVESAPLIVLDKPVKKISNGFKEACRVVSFAWLFTLAFMAQVVIAQDVLADLFSLMVIFALALNVIGK